MKNKPLFATRDFQGYFQYIEEFNLGDNIEYRWIFYICGFSPTGTMASVLKSDGTKDSVPIDEKDRILINGRLYVRNHWNH